jgi:uncharacterized protein YndB with AHSA1/START domain
MKKLMYHININAPVARVWDSMLSPDTYEKWTNVSWPGSFYTGSWEEGEHIRFVSDNGSGTMARITKLIPLSEINAEHIAILLPGGVEDSESEMAKGWVGIQENYSFQSEGATTRLVVEIVTHPEWQKMFDEGWPGALAKLKEICEA